MELLTEPKVKGYIIGASNVLFRQKRNLADILIDVDNLTMQCYVSILSNWNDCLQNQIEITHIWIIGKLFGLNIISCISFGFISCFIM